MDSIRSHTTVLPIDRSATENELLVTSPSTGPDGTDIRLLRFSLSEMKRASSVPTAASSSVKLSRSTASAKALFRIELPTIKSYKLHPPFLGRSKPRTPVSATTSECGCSRLGLSQFHGFAVDDQEISSLRSTPLTPPDETSFDLPNMTEPEHSAVDANATISTRAPEEPIPEMQGLCLESVASTWSNQGPTDNRPNSEQHSEADQRESEAASSADLPSQSISAPSPWLDETIDIACKFRRS